MSTELTIRKLPSLSELYSDKEGTIEQSSLNIILNAEPKKEWIKDDKIIKGNRYLPIERVEYLLTMIFGKWEVIVKDVKIIANSVVVTITLRVKDPLNQNEWMSQDGIGATPLSTRQGAGATDFNQMLTAAVRTGAPSAESFAIKDAAEKFGKIFGKDLNRRDEIGYKDPLHSSIDAVEKLNIIRTISKLENEQKLKEFWITLSEKERQDPDIAQAAETLRFGWEPTVQTA